MTRNRIHSYLLVVTPCLVSLALLAGWGCSLQEGDAEVEPAETVREPVRPANRLGHESSPYLRAHAHNPVDWYPWGPEALDKARKEGKLIFLSIGYSSCHWCHVMERKVFSDPAIARFMNEHFVNIKVDREERPDLDDIYMTALTLYFRAIGSTQTGGWPLSLFLTPDGKPLGGGTYFPPKDEEDRVGFQTLMDRVVQSWGDNRAEMEANAEILARAVQASARLKFSLKPVRLEPALVTDTLAQLRSAFDDEFGGFGFQADDPERPKFPVPPKLALLQYVDRRQGDKEAGKMLYLTLDRMAAGGLYDQLGGGFHRYSTDRYWRVPHFEKMLYDNAQLAEIYAEAWMQTGRPHYRKIAEETLAFILRDLTDPQGAFYCALDAETAGVEGSFYVWTEDQLRNTLTPEELTLCRLVYGLENTPSFEHGHVLQFPRPLPDVAAGLNLPTMQLDRQLADIRKKLLAARAQRTPLLRDDKILTSWNGLTIRALARAGAIFQKPDYTRAAEKAASFVLTSMRDDKGRLVRSYRSRQAQLNAYLDDYAFLVDGLLALHTTTGDDKWLNAARRLTDQQLEQFWDERQKGCFYTSHDHEVLIARTKDAYDSVHPSGNSATIRNLLQLAARTRDNSYRDRAREALEFFIPLLDASPGGLANLVIGIAEYLDNPAQSAAPRSAPLEPVFRDLALTAAGPATPPVRLTSNEQPAPKKKPELVTAAAYLSVDRLPAGKTARIYLHLQIAPRWHINANPAEPDYLVPTTVTVKSKLGTTLAQIRYPPSEEIDGPDGEKTRVYSDRAGILGLLQIPEKAGGRREELTVTIKYQACNDTQCLPPTTLTVTLPVDVAPAGEPVNPANPKIFNPPVRQ